MAKKVIVIEAPLADEIIVALSKFEYKNRKRIRKQLFKYAKKLHKADVEIFKETHYYIVHEQCVCIFAYKKDIKKIEDFFNKTITDDIG